MSEGWGQFSCFHLLRISSATEEWILLVTLYHRSPTHYCKCWWLPCPAGAAHWGCQTWCRSLVICDCSLCRPREPNPVASLQCPLLTVIVCCFKDFIVLHQFFTTQKGGSCQGYRRVKESFLNKDPSYVTMWPAFRGQNKGYLKTLRETAAQPGTGCQNSCTIWSTSDSWSLVMSFPHHLYHIYDEIWVMAAKIVHLSVHITKFKTHERKKPFQLQQKKVFNSSVFWPTYSKACVCAYSTSKK